MHQVGMVDVRQVTNLGALICNWGILHRHEITMFAEAQLEPRLGPGPSGTDNITVLRHVYGPAKFLSLRHDCGYLMRVVYTFRSDCTWMFPASAIMPPTE